MTEMTDPRTLREARAESLLHVITTRPEEPEWTIEELVEWCACVTGPRDVIEQAIDDLKAADRIELYVSGEGIYVSPLESELAE